MELRWTRQKASKLIAVALVSSATVFSCLAASAEDNTPNLKGKVSTPDASWADIKSEDGLPFPTARDLGLWVKMSVGKSGVIKDIKPLLSARVRKLNDAEREHFWSEMNDSPEVQKRIDQWKVWYANILQTVREQMPSTPKEVRFKVSVTVNKDKTISPSVDFADKTPNFDSDIFADKICFALKKLNGTDALAFPGKSDPEMVRFIIQTDSFENTQIFSTDTNLGL